MFVVFGHQSVFRLVTLCYDQNPSPTETEVLAAVRGAISGSINHTEDVLCGTWPCIREQNPVLFSTYSS